MDDLDRMLERWTAGGLITPEQARAIRAAEGGGGAGRAVPVVAEVIGYVGAAFALSAVGIVASQMWADLGTGQKLGLLAVVAGLLWAGGWWIWARGSGVPGRLNPRTPAFSRGSGVPGRLNPRTPARRLGSVLWFLSAGTMGWLADVAFNQGLDLGDQAWLGVGLVASTYAAVLYLGQRMFLQLLALAGGVTALCAGVADVAGGDEWFGPLLWVAGSAWIGLTRAGELTPTRAGYALGSIGVLAGAEALTIEFFDNPNALGLGLGLVSAAALLVLSLRFKEIVLLGFGAAGLFLFVAQFTEEYLAGSLGAPLALLVAGAGLLVVALVTARLKDRVESERGHGA